MTVVKYHPERREATTLLCRSWLCEHCREDRKRALIAQAHRGRANTFITITVRRDEFKTPNQAAAALARAWRVIVKRALRQDNIRLKRKEKAAERSSAVTNSDLKLDLPVAQVTLEKGRLEYLVVIEAHASGWPHLHILCRSQWIAQKWLSTQLLDVLKSPICYVQRLTKRAQIGAYVAKYCGKCAHKFGNTKRYWQTRGFQLTKYEPVARPKVYWHDVARSHARLCELAESWSSQQWAVAFESNWHLTASPPCSS